MVYFFSITGRVSGSARINVRRGRTEVCLKLRRNGLGELGCFLTDGNHIEKLTLKNGCGNIGETEVSALALTDDSGSIVSVGNRNLTAKEMEDFRTGVRLMLGEQKRTDGKEALNKQGQKAKLKSGAERMLPSGSPLSSDIPHSSAAADILDMANYLFRGGEPKRNKDTAQEVRQQNTEGKVSARDTMPEEPEAIENPFPQFFPNNRIPHNAARKKDGEFSQLFSCSVNRCNKGLRAVVERIARNFGFAFPVVQSLYNLVFRAGKIAFRSDCGYFHLLFFRVGCQLFEFSSAGKFQPHKHARAVDELSRAYIRRAADDFYGKAERVVWLCQNELRRAAGNVIAEERRADNFGIFAGFCRRHYVSRLMRKPQSGDVQSRRNRPCDSLSGEKARHIRALLVTRSVAVRDGVDCADGSEFFH